MITENKYFKIYFKCFLSFSLSLKVGLDIQQNYTAFFLGAKRFGNQVAVHRKSDAESSLDVYHAPSIKASSARIDTGK